MTFLFRSINKRRWDWKAGSPTWLLAGQIPAAPFGDVSPDPESTLSMWWIDDDESNLSRVVAALAAGRQHPDKVDCTLIEEAALRELGVQIEAIPEPCPDQEASDRWHRNVLRLTADHLYRLVSLMKDTGRTRRFLKPEVEGLLNDGLKSGVLDAARVKPSLKESLQHGQAA